MFDIYIRDFNQNGSLVTTETLVQSIPAETEGDLKLISPIVKCEMGNAESFTFNIEGGTKFYDAFNQMKTFMRVVYDGDTIFYGRVLTIENSFYGTRKIRLEGPLAFLNDTSIEGKKEESRPERSVNSYLGLILSNHNRMCADPKRCFQPGEVPGNYSYASAEQQIPNASRKFGQDGWSDTKGAIEDLRSHYGGYLRVRYVPNSNLPYYDIDNFGLGTIDLNSRQVVHNSDGSFSTEKAFTTEVDGQFILIPSIINGQVVSAETAVAHYLQTDEYLGKFDTIEEADSYAEELHKRQQWYYGPRSESQLYLDWMNHYFTKEENTQTIEVGKNVIDISASTEIDNIFTVVIPIGNSKSTSSATVDGTKKSTGPKHFYVQGKEVTVPSICPIYGSALNSGYHTYDDYAQALNRYGRIVKTVTFDDADDPAELLVKCREWIKNNYQGEVTKFTVKAVDMHQVGDTSVSKIMVGDRVRIKYPIIKEDGTTEQGDIVRTCLSISYDLYNPENNAYTFGIPANILTKSYGVTKQANSTSQASTTPKSSSGGTNTSEEDWLTKVTRWLSHHKIRYRHNEDGSAIDSRVWPNRFPYQDAYKEFEKGPYSGLLTDHRNYFYDIETSLGVGRFALWKFTPVGTSDEYSQEELDAFLDQVERSMPNAPPSVLLEAKRSAEASFKSSFRYKDYTQEIVTLKGILTQEHIIQCNIIPYVKSEYGIDLTKFSNVKMPTITYTDEDGVTKTQEATDDGRVITKEMFKKDYDGQDAPEGWHIVTSPDGRRVGSCQDEQGHWTYWEIDDKGNVVPTSIRDLALGKLDSDRIFGSMITENMIGEDGKVHTYLFAQAIEQYKDGELVVVHNEGDVAYLGFGPGDPTTGGSPDPNHSYYVAVSNLRHTDTVAGQIHYENDEQGVPVLKLDSAGGLRVRRGVINEDGSFVYDDDPTSPTYGQQIVSEFGVYDGNNLTGGVMVQKLNGKTITTINGTEIKVGGSQTLEIHITAQELAEFGLIDPVTKTLTGGMIVDKLDDGTVSTKISGDIIDISANSEFGTISQTVAKHTTSITENGNKIDAFTGSTLWANKDNIVNVCGNYEVVTAEDGVTKTLVVKAGGGMNIRRDGVEYGLYDNGNLTGGLMVEKINSEATTKIAGKNVEVTASHMASLGVWRDGQVGAERIGVIVNGINGGSTLINTDKLQFTGTKVDLGSKLGIINEGGTSHISLKDDNVIVGSGTNLIRLRDGEVRAWKYTYYASGSGGAGSVEHSMLRDAYVNTSSNTAYLKRFNDSSALTFSIDSSTNTLTISDSDGHSINFSKAAAATKISGSWSGGYLTVVADPNGSDLFKRSFKYGRQVYSSDKKHVTVYADVYRMSDIGASNEYLDTSDAFSLYVPVTETWDAGYDLGWRAAYDQVNVNYLFPTTSPTTYPQSIQVATPGPNSTSSRTNYQYYVTAENDYAYIRYGGAGASSPIVARVKNDAYSSGQNAVKVSSTMTWEYSATNSEDSNSVTFTTDAPNPVSGASKTLSLFLTQPDAFTDHSKTISLRTGSTKGNIYAQTVVDASGEYSGGWNAARNSVLNKTYTVSGNTYSYFPTVQPGTLSGSIRVAQPSSTVDSGITAFYTYFASSDDEWSYIRYQNSVSGPIVARKKNQAYANGQNSVKVSSAMTWSHTSTYTGNSNSVTFTTDAPNPVSGASKTLSLFLTQPDAFTVDDTTYTKTISLRAGSTSGNIYGQIVVDASSVYSSGLESATVNGSWNSSGVYTAKNVYGPSNKAYTQLADSVVSDIKWTGNMATVKINAYNNGSSLKVYTGKSIKVTAPLMTKRITENNQTYMPDTGNVGFSSVTVAVPDYHISEEWGTGDNKNKLTVARSISATGTGSTHIVTARASLSYNSSTHKYTATGYADCDGENRASVTDPESTAQGYNDGISAVRLFADWDTYQKNKMTVSKTTSTSYGETYNLYVTADLDDYSYDSTTHQYYTTARAKTGTSNSGTMTERNASQPKYTDTRAYEDGRTSITSTGKAAATYGVSTSERVISAGQYLSGDQKIRAVTTEGIWRSNVRYGTTIKVGDIDNPTSIKNVAGTFTQSGTQSGGNQIARPEAIRAGFSAWANGQEVIGEMPELGAETFIPTTTDQYIYGGQYVLGMQTIKGDSNLIASNIRSGSTMFNVSGTFTAAGTQTNPGSQSIATSAAIRKGYTAWAKGVEVQGSIPNLGAKTWMPTTSPQTITAGQYLTGPQTIPGSPNLIASSIKYNTTIFNVNGTFTKSGTQSSGSPAGTGDILSGRTAWVDGAEVHGSIPTLGTLTYVPGTSNQTISAGRYLSGDQLILGSANLVAENIKDGIPIFGVRGTYKGDASANIDHVVTSSAPYDDYIRINSSTVYRNNLGGNTYFKSGSNYGIVVQVLIDDAAGNVISKKFDYLINAPTKIFQAGQAAGPGGDKLKAYCTGYSSSTSSGHNYTFTCFASPGTFSSGSYYYLFAKAVT